MNVYRTLKYCSNKIKNYVVGAEGNISARINDGFLVKSSGVKISNISDSMFTKSFFTKCDFDGNYNHNKFRKPSMETNFHSMLYKKYSWCNFIVHTHPIYTTSVLCSDRAEEFTTNKLFPDHVVYNHNSILIEYTHPGIELSDLIYEKLSQSNYDISLILLKNHGIIALGKDIDTCIIITEMCEKAAQIYINTHTLSTPVFLTKEQIKLIQDDEHEKYRQSLYQ